MNIRGKSNRNIDIFSDGRIIPTIGTILVGKYAGLEFSIFGGSDTPNCFNRTCICSVCNGKVAMHRGCVFRRATYEEAFPLYKNFTVDVYNEIVKHSHFIKPIWAIPLKGKYKGIRYPFYTVPEISKFFTACSVRSVLRGDKAFYLGFDFAHIKTEEFLSDDIKNVLTEEIFNMTNDALDAPFIATVIQGPYEGTMFGMVSKSAVRRHLNPRLITKVFNGIHHTYRGCTLEFTTYERAVKFVPNFTMPLKKSLRIR